MISQNTDGLQSFTKKSQIPLNLDWQLISYTRHYQGCIGNWLQNNWTVLEDMAWNTWSTQTLQFHTDCEPNTSDLQGFANKREHVRNSLEAYLKAAHVITLETNKAGL